MSLNAYKADAAALMTTANTLARYSDTNGKFATSNVTLDASNNMIIPGNLTADGVTTGSLVVNGASIFVNQANFNVIPTAPTPDASSNDTSVATTAFVISALTGISSPMRFIGSLGTEGTATSLPTASNENQGYTYKVITADTYQGVTAKVGDVLVSNGTSWVLIPSGDEPSGTVTSITPGNGLLNGTTTDAITTSGTLNINYGTTTANIGTAAAGSATTVSRSDHVHAIDLATGDANGQVKIAGTNINVKGLGSAAYTESSAYAASSHTHYWANIITTTAAAYNATPEMATLKLNGNTNASAPSTSNVSLVYDATLEALNFVFA